MTSSSSSSAAVRAAAAAAVATTITWRLNKKKLNAGNDGMDIEGSSKME